MKQITTGDMLHAYGSFGLHMNYAVRLTVRLTDRIDGVILANALRKTQTRFPFLSVRIRKILPVFIMRTTRSLLSC